CIRTRSSSNLLGESSPNPTSSNPKHRNRRRSNQPFILEESSVETMADQRESRRWLKKEPPRSILTWEDLVSKFINEFFPPSRTTNLCNEISNFQQRFDESFHEAWDQYKDLLQACPHHAGGNLLERRTQDVLTFIENKSKVRNSRNKSIVSQVKSSDANSSSSSEIAKLTHAVNQQTSSMTTAMTTNLKQFQATPHSAFVKAVKEICVTCGGAHPYYQCLAADGNTFLEFWDNIQGYVSAVVVNYNQGPFPINTIANPKGGLKAITTRSGIVLDGPFIPMPPPFINPEEDERVEETLIDPELGEFAIKVPPPLVQKPKPPSQRNYVVHQRDPRHPNIPYPSRMYKKKQQEKDEVQIHKFWQMFKQLHINITLADALILILKYQKMLKALISNKEKLLEVANTPLNENCSAVILKKLPVKLGDPMKFLIPCDFSELKCKALADLGPSINLMSLSVWKKLGLPELISTRMTFELANRAICTSARIARDVFVPAGKFRFPADFVIVDYESDHIVPLILGRPFLRTARALIDVHGEEMILRDSDERLTLNMRHDTSNYSNQPRKESINMINIFNNSCEDYLEDLFATNHLSGNPTFSSHTDLTSPEVKDDIFDPEGDIEFADELALITFPLGNDDLLFDIDNLANPNVNLFDTIFEMFIDEHAFDYSSPPLYDDYDDDLDEFESDNDDAYNDPFDSNGEKIKESKLLIDELGLPRSSDFIPSHEYDSFLFEDFSEVDALPSTNNEDKVFNPSILIHENFFEVNTRVAPNKNVKKIAISHVILKDFDHPLYELPFQKEVPGSKTLLSFSSENEEKVFKPGILTSKGVCSSLLSKISHGGPKAFIVNKILESPMEIFPCSFREDIRILDVS
nr:reverse transcriptase domain-containing protein [Tanacetum cinerariifolium]